MSQRPGSSIRVTLALDDRENESYSVQISGAGRAGIERRHGGGFDLAALALAAGQEMTISMASTLAVDRIKALIESAFGRHRPDPGATLSLTVRVDGREITGTAQGEHAATELAELARTLLERDT